MSMKRIKVVLFLFIFIQGILYVFLIPPGQSPDEWHHFGYGVVLSKGGKAIPAAYENVDKKIVESMAAFHAWKYQYVPRPDPLPHKYSELTLYGKHSLRNLSRRAPLYYVISSFLIKGTKINGFLNQFYLIRGFSLILFLLSVYFTYLSARILFKDNPLYCFAAVSFVSFLPQFVIISTSVNPINLAVFLETIFIYLMILSLHKKKILLVGLFGPLIIALGFFNHRAALFMIPPFLLLLLIYFINSLKNKKELLKIFLIILGIIFLFFVIYLTAHHFFPDLLNRAIHESAIGTRKAEINRFFQIISFSSSNSLSIFSNYFFMSFWYYAGWMRFPYLLDIYSILKLICLLSFLGLTKYLLFIFSRKNYKPSINLKLFLIFGAAVVPIILAVIIRYIPKNQIVQGRYIFPAISALAVLFVLGLKEIVPKKLENWLPIFIILGFIVLDIYTIFNSLIRVFYYFTNA